MLDTKSPIHLPPEGRSILGQGDKNIYYKPLDLLAKSMIFGYVFGVIYILLIICVIKENYIWASIFAIIGSIVGISKICLQWAFIVKQLKEK